MAYFHCLIGGGSSGGGYELTVTCDADFAGTTITATDGVTTLTQTCPSDSPYEVVFAIPNGGEWTISGIISGQTYSTAIDIPDSLELHSIPEGSTVLPTDDIQTWLACAGITDKSYTTLNEVLADSTTLLALMSNNNAVDYLVRSTSWAGDSSVQVPTMTSATAPSGEASGMNYNQSYPPYLVFDGNDSTFCAINAPSNTVTGATNLWVQYHFTNAVVINKFLMKYQDTYSSKHDYITKVKLQGSNDGNTFTDITTETINSTTEEKSFSNNTAYEYYRFLIVDGTVSNYSQISFMILTLQFYCDGLTLNSTAMTDIGANNYCANTLLADATWRTAICNSTYFESVLNTKVPTMTSNTTPSGTVIGASEVWNNMYLWYAFDGNDNTYASPSSDSYVGYEFTQAVKVFKLDILLGETGVAGSNGFILEKYVNNNWVQILDESNITTNAHNQYSFANSDATTKYRITLKMSQVTQCAITIQFYGRVDV